MSAPSPALLAEPTNVGTGRLRPDIQGLRAVAVLSVVLFHAGPFGFTGGFVGVDVFFVISGYLITGILLRSLAKPGSLRSKLSSFYARRIRRILPASILVAVSTLIAAYFLMPAILYGGALRDGVASVSYWSNIYFGAEAVDYWADASPSPFQHFWSLAVEEQFYLIWPLLLAGIVLISRNRRWLSATLTLVLVLVSFGFSVSLTASTPLWAFYLPHTRFWELGVGALLAILASSRQPRELGLATRQMVTGAGVLGASLICWALFRFDDATPFPGSMALLPVLGTALLLAAGQVHPTNLCSRALSVRPARFFGDISYSLYLWHWPVLILAQYQYEDALPTPLRLACIAVAIALSIASYRWVEQPFRQLGSTQSSPKPKRWKMTDARVVLVGLTITAILVTVMTVTASAADSRSAHANRAAPLYQFDAPVVGTNFVPSNMAPSLPDLLTKRGSVREGCDIRRQTVQDCSVGAVNGSVTWVLLGDSHANHLVEALDLFGREHGVRIIRLSKANCPAVDAPHKAPAGMADCNEFRAAVRSVINQLRPALALISNSSGFTMFDTNGKAISDPIQSRQVWNDGLVRFVQQLPPETNPLVLEQTPKLGTQLIGCLSEHLTDISGCIRPRTKALNQVFLDAQRTALAAAKVPLVSINDRLCNETECPAILGNILVYTDGDHFTVEFSRALSPALAAALVAAGAPVG